MKGKLGQFFQSLRQRDRNREDLHALDPWSVRGQSIKKTEHLGYPVNPNLPLLEIPRAEKSPDDIFKRMLCMNIAAACAFGFDRGKGRQWLEQEEALDALSPKEVEFLNTGEGDLDEFKNGVEGLWAFAWALGLVKRFDYEEASDDDFVTLFPDIGKVESSARLKAKIKPRPLSTCFKQLDLAYCLHWAIRDAQINGRKPAGFVHPAVVYERRKALEWLLGGEEWDDVSMDT